MAVGRIPRLLSLEEAFPSWKSPHLLIALDGIADAENIGVIIRNSAAFGVDAMLVGETCCSPYLRRSVRVSLGAIFSVQIVLVPHLPSTLSKLTCLAGTRILAACPQGTDRMLWETDLSGSICLVFGGEAYGLSPLVRHECHEEVIVPMAAGADSLNVACATSVFLYEALRQRRL
jgi:tRNA G18 (ribose-2'-O)-methylase SpoU